VCKQFTYVPTINYIFVHNEKHFNSATTKRCLDLSTAKYNITGVVLGGVVLVCLPLDPRFAGSGRWIFNGDRNLQLVFLRKGSKAVGHMS
jgi:hypothetical protein